MKSSLWLAAGILAASTTLFSCQSVQQKNPPLVHAHRGGAALYPENTIAAMLNAVKLGVPVLELDLQITKDNKVVVSHDPFLNSIKALTPQGDTIAKVHEMEYKIYSMPYDSLCRYDVGSLPNPAFAHRKNMKCSIPLVSALIDSVENYIDEHDLPPVSYNIEIKSDPRADNIFSPPYKTFADLCMGVLLPKKLGSRLLIQCFDVRTLNYVHKTYPNVRLSYLAYDFESSFDELMAKLDFKPQVYSPESRMVTQEVVDAAHAKGIAVAPWTVDDKKEIERLTALGVEAIITNQPDSVMHWLGYPPIAKPK